LAVFQGASDERILNRYVRSEQRGKTANWPRPKKNALNQVFPAARAKNVSFVIGSSLNAGFISGSPRYNYGKESYKIPAAFIEKRRKLLDVATNHGVDPRRVLGGSQSAESDRAKRASAAVGARGRELRGCLKSPYSREVRVNPPFVKNCTLS
jgi:hypothetical protein